MSLDRMISHLEQNTSSLDAARQVIFDLVSASSKDRFVFTSSGAESISQVFWSVYLEVARKQGKTHIIVSEKEDAPTMQAAKLFEELGCTIKIAPVDENGRIDLEKLASLISPRTALISVTMAHKTTGVIQPVEEIVKLAKEKGVLLHLDANYAIGKLFFAFESDYLTFSGDQIHSVKGSGALFAKETAPLVPLIQGEGLRGGALDAPSFAAFSAACQQMALYLDMMSLEVARLRSIFEEETGGNVLFANSLRLPNVTALAFEGVHHEALLYLLYRKNIHATLGDGFISFSLSRMTTEEEIHKAAAIIKESVQLLKNVAGDL